MKKVTRPMIMMLSGIFLVLWIAGYLGFLGAVIMQKPGPDTKTDAIVVVTGGAGRIRTGLELLASGKVQNLMISGVDKKVGLSEIYSMWDGDSHAVECCVTLGHEASNTKENAAETLQWVRDNEFKSLRLVTSNYHIPRTRMEFRRAMPDTHIIFHPVKTLETEKSGIRFFYIAFTEYNKTMLTFLRHSFDQSG